MNYNPVQQVNDDLTRPENVYFKFSAQKTDTIFYLGDLTASYAIQRIALCVS